MTFRDKMKVAVSSAEVRVRSELQRRNLHHGLMTGQVIMLDTGEIIQRENLLKQQATEKRRQFTVPDLLWATKKLPVYLDGPVHKRRGVRNRDNRITTKLTEHGFHVTRFSYAPPLSTKRLKEITDTIGELLNE